MIDFATSMQKTKRLHEQQVKEDRVGDKFGDTLDDDKVASPILDATRRSIALRPAFYLTIAFSVGGLLGWLTSKR